MFLSAITLAALLQAAPVAGETSFLLQRWSFETGQRVDQLRLPAPKVRRSAPLLEGAFLPAPRSPPRITWRKATPSPLGFVRGPGTARCINNAPETVASTDALTAHPLSEMPDARGERAVARLIDGCAVPVLVEQRAPAP